MRAAKKSTNDEAENLARVVEMGRAALDAEAVRTDRFNATATSQATLAGAWFAVAQTVAAVTLSGHAARGWIIGVVAGLLVQAISLAALLYGTSRVWALRVRDDVGSDTLGGLVDRAGEPSAEFSRDVIGLYRWVLYYAQETNDQKADAFQPTSGKFKDRVASPSFWWLPVLLLGVAEVTVALLSRVL